MAGGSDIRSFVAKLGKPALKIDLISRRADVPGAVTRLLDRGFGMATLFGMDCEWDNAAQEIPDLLQIAKTDGYCALFRLNLLKTVPRQLKNLLENKKYSKVGIGIVEDVKKLRYGFGVMTRGVLDLRYLAEDRGVDPKGMSYLCKRVLGETRDKCNHSSRCWTVASLTERKKRYAALDALNAVRIFVKLNHEKICEKWDSDWKGWNPEEYERTSLRIWYKYFGKNFHY